MLIHIILYRDVHEISVPEGLGTCPFGLLAEICCDKSAVKKIANLDTKNKNEKTEITAIKQ